MTVRQLRTIAKLWEMGKAVGAAMLRKDAAPRGSSMRDMIPILKIVLFYKGGIKR